MVDGTPLEGTGTLFHYEIDRGRPPIPLVRADP